MMETRERIEKMDPQQYRERKEQERAEVFEMLSQSTQSLLQPEQLQAYLDLQSRFLPFSASNVLLIKEQKPQARWLRTFDDWKADNVSVKKGENGILVFESSYYQKEDGSMGRSMKVARLFDISQTNAADRCINMPSHRNLPDYLPEAAGCPVEVSDRIAEGIDGIWDPQQDRIFLRPDLPRDQRFIVTAREAAARDLAGEKGSREAVLPYAQCSAYILARRYGMEAAPTDLQKLTAHFPGMEEKDVRRELSLMKNAAAVLDARMLEARTRDRQAKGVER